MWKSRLKLYNFQMVSTAAGQKGLIRESFEDSKHYGCISSCQLKECVCVCARTHVCLCVRGRHKRILINRRGTQSSGCPGDSISLIDPSGPSHRQLASFQLDKFTDHSPQPHPSGIFCLMCQRLLEQQWLPALTASVSWLMRRLELLEPPVPL